MNKILTFFICALAHCTAYTAAASATEFETEILIKNHRFIPEIVKVPAGVKIKLTVHNQDDTVEEFESIDLKREKIIPGNSKIKIILAPLEPGEYKFFGDFYSDTAQGVLVSVKEEN